ncbi:unnamed protein product [Staurois parvus]|uniref:Uncharacterized protein n=1 Tax=Staurois parvus TaxID=386267 RepID=A0ABN9DJQ6_9NEOB|nr:unnamed protein product [Staurois parvus]
MGPPGNRGSWGPLCSHKMSGVQGWTDNSWDPREIGDHGAPCVLAQTQKSL